MLAIFMNLFGERSQDWLYRYRIEWEAPACAAWYERTHKLARRGCLDEARL